MITKASEEYLKTMYVLKKQNGNIRVTDIANKMNCTKPSVNKALNNLKEEKLVKYETYGIIELTEQGENLAQKILEAYDIVYLFLKDVLDLDEQSARLYNLLDVCGGILEDADIEKLNLAKKLVDSEKIVITKKLEKQNIEEIEEKIDESEGTYYIDEDAEKININNASKEELMSLNGIGESTANKIIEYRKKNSFVDIEDIMNVDGIGKSKYENIKNHICI